jgi:hypothetical protein
VQRILKNDFNLYVYQMTVLPKLTCTVQIKHHRKAFAEWAQNNKVSFSSVWFADDAHFHLNGMVNKKKYAIWGVRESMCGS